MIPTAPAREQTSKMTPEQLEAQTRTATSTLTAQLEYRFKGATVLHLTQFVIYYRCFSIHSIVHKRGILL